MGESIVVIEDGCTASRILHAILSFSTLCIPCILWFISGIWTTECTEYTESDQDI